MFHKKRICEFCEHEPKEATELYADTLMCGDCKKLQLEMKFRFNEERIKRIEARSGSTNLRDTYQEALDNMFDPNKEQLFYPKHIEIKIKTEINEELKDSPKKSAIIQARSMESASRHFVSWLIKANPKGLAFLFENMLQKTKV